jgi:hypothetical protein
MIVHVCFIYPHYRSVIFAHNFGHICPVPSSVCLLPCDRTFSGDPMRWHGTELRNIPDDCISPLCTHRPDWVLDASFPHKTEVMYCIGFYSLLKKRARRERVRASVKKKSFSDPPTGADRLQIFTLNLKDWLAVAMTRAWSERVNLYSRQIMILPRKTTTNCAT